MYFVSGAVVKENGDGDKVGLVARLLAGNPSLTALVFPGDGYSTSGIDDITWKMRHTVLTPKIVTSLLLFWAS